MKILDANVILRYLLNDDVEMAAEAEKVIKAGFALVTIEIIAEVVYVLKGVYSIGREEISKSLLEFLLEVASPDSEVLRVGIKTYAEQKLDFPDCILYAYHQVKGYEIMTFDKKLNRLLEAKTDIE